jgi:hypothetical protein
MPDASPFGCVYAVIEGTLAANSVKLFSCKALTLGRVPTEVRLSEVQGVTLYIERRTFLTAMTSITSDKKVRLRAVETMKNLEKNGRKKGAIHHQLMSAPDRDQTARCRPAPTSPSRLPTLPDDLAGNLGS